MFKYIVTGSKHKAMAIHSDLLLLDLQDLIRSQSRPIHEESGDRVWSWGAIDFVNPQVMMVSDFADYIPALIGVK